MICLVFALNVKFFLYFCVVKEKNKTEYTLVSYNNNYRDMKRTVIMICLALASIQLSAQNIEHYKRVIKALSSAKYQGRGYAKDGANKAGKYLQKEFQFH